MSDVGRLELSIVWDGEIVRDARVHFTRPRTDRLLAGCAPQEVTQRVSRLFSVYGRAQAAAAEVATAVAQGREPTQTFDGAVACEAMREHLWRLLLDWPTLPGLPKQPAIFARWHSVLQGIEAGVGNAQAFSDELHRVLTGMTSGEWARLDSRAALIEWSKSGHGLCAPVVAALHARECALARDETTRDAPDSDIGMDGAEGCDLLPAWPDTGIWRDWAGDFDVIFAAQPHYAGRPMETGAFARWQCQPLLHDLLRQRPGRLLARLVARLYDLLDSAKKLARRESAQRIQWVATETGVGLALAHTARGLLIHHARVEQGRIADYCIVPPTAWNFHPRGAWRAGLVNLRERDILRLSETAWCLALSLDPCVAYTMRVCHA